MYTDEENSDKIIDDINQDFTNPTEHNSTISKLKINIQKDRVAKDDKTSNQVPAAFKTLSKVLWGGVMNRAVNVSEYVVTFHFGRFFKMLMYHIAVLYLGPLIVPIISLIDTKALS